MICDRTKTDVDNAMALREKIQSGQTLTEAEKTTFERGMCTINMLNRIENKQAELAESLVSNYYDITLVNKQWTYNDIFTWNDYVRLLNNLDELKRVFCTYPTSPVTPTYMYGYSEANDVEKILIDIEELISNMSKTFVACGIYQCGNTNV